MVYIDHVHMVADSLEELHAFAKMCGIKPCWFECSTTHPHYDVMSRHREIALKNGAREVTSKEILLLSKKLINP